MKHDARSLRLSTLTLGFLAATLTAACSDVPDHLLGTGGGDSSGTLDTVTSSDGSGGGTTTSAGTGGEGGTAQTAVFGVSVDETAPALDLRDTTNLTVTIEPNGYTGDVLLHVDGLPSDVTSQLSGSTVSLDGTSPKTIGLTLTTLSSTATGSFAFQVTGTSPGGSKSAAASLTVNPVITIIIPKDLATYANTTQAFGDYPTMIKALPTMDATHTITVKFFNDDTVPHEIHADQGAEGFPHGTGSIDPGSFDPVVRKVTAADTFDFYPHDLGNGPTILGEIVIQ